MVPKPLNIAKWLGLVDTAAPEALKPGELSVALDVDVDGEGKLRSRRGMTLVSATPSHSMFAAGDLCVLVQGNDMKRMDESGALTQLKRLAYGGPVSYVESNGVVYFSNGVDTGRIVQGAVREWGVRVPISQPSAAAAGNGGLPPGRYLYAMTFLRSDGQESGTKVPGLIELTVQGGIAFSGMEVSSDPDVAGKVLYISLPNGSELYRAAVVPAATTSYSYLERGLDLGPPLDPEPVEPPPPGTLLEVHGGCMYVADGSVVWVSELYNFERFRRAKRFLQVTGPVNLLASVDTGLYVGTDEATWYFGGTDPMAMQPAQVLEVGAVPGTAVKFDSGERVSGESDQPISTRPAAYWMSNDGVIVGYAGGDVRKITMDNYGIPPAVRGAALLRTQRGYVSYIASLRGSAAAGNQYP